MTRDGAAFESGIFTFGELTKDAAGDAIAPDRRLRDLLEWARMELAPHDSIPELIDGPAVAQIDGSYYRVEAWRIVDGRVVVVVRGLVDARSLALASEKVASAVHARWGAGALIIEDWGQKGMLGERYRISSEDGGSSEPDFEALRNLGIVLDENRFQEP